MMTLHTQIIKQLQYKSWANVVSFQALKQLPKSELEKSRLTTFGNMLSTLNHIYVVDDIFKAHLTGAAHGYSARNTAHCPALEQIEKQQTEMDQWYLDLATTMDTDRLFDIVDFEYVGGGDGSMSIYDILQHLVNHATYHHGFVSDMMYQVPVVPPANDYTVFLRDVRDTYAG